MKIESTTISATPRKLKAVWSYEAAQDLRAWHNIDAEAQLTNDLAAAINQEIDNEILEDLRRQAEEKPWGFRKKKRPPVRKITDDWEVSNLS